MCVAVLVFVAQAALAATVRVTAERVNLRSHASTDSQIVTAVTKGTLMEMVGREGDWYRVLIPGTGNNAYIHSAICEFVSGPAMATAPQPAPVPQYAPAAAPAVPYSAPTAPVASPRPVPVGQAPAAARTARPEKTASGGSERPVSFGVHGSYATEDLGLGAGGRLAMNLSGGSVGLMGTFDYLFGEAGVSFLFAEGYATYTFPGDSARPYVGAGASFGKINGVCAYDSPGAGCSSIKPSLLGGVRFSRFFAEARYRLGTGDHLTVSAGIQF